MPEFPEVACCVRSITSALVGNRITRVLISDKLKHRGRPTCIEGKVVSHIRQWGKYIIVYVKEGSSTRNQRQHRNLRNGEPAIREPSVGRSALILHLGMSGMLIPSHSSDTDAKSVKHAHAQILWESSGRHLGSGAGASFMTWTDVEKEKGVVYFSDPRRFGRMWFCRNHKQLWKVLSRIGPDPLMLGTSKEDEYSTSRLNTKLGAQRFIQRMRSIPQQRKIKDVLMNQGCVSGFGNIYASEALHLAGISPRRKLERIADAWLALLYSESISLFIRATMAGGSSVHSFRGPDGKEGEAQKAHRVYSREKCGSCDSPVRVTKMKGRTTYSCPQCQK